MEHVLVDDMIVERSKNVWKDTRKSSVREEFTGSIAATLGRKGGRLGGKVTPNLGNAEIYPQGYHASPKVSETSSSLDIQPIRGWLCNHINASAMLLLA